MKNYVDREFGKYRLINLIGVGGFAEVYRGKHLVLETEVAIKVLRVSFLDKEKENFLEEARTLARLKHHHIVPIYDFDVEDREHIPFLVMEYASHGNIQEYHADALPLPTKTVVSYVKQIASALQYAHEHETIHRDIKPENLLLNEKGEILITDFGIAIVQKTGTPTKEALLGSAYYMAPEQWDSGSFGRPSPATDQYAVGVIAYQWLTGECPFQGLYTEIGSQHVKTLPEPPSKKNPDIPTEIDEVVLKSLEKTPEERFKNIQTFANELEQAYKKTTGDAEAPPQVWLINKRISQYALSGVILYTLVNSFLFLIKRDIFSVVPSYFLYSILHSDFSATLLFPLILLGLSESIPLFFGAAFGPWVGLCTGGVGLFIAGILSMNYFHWWPLNIGVAMASFIAGLALFQTRGRYETRKAFAIAEIMGVLGQIIGGVLATSLTFFVFFANEPDVYEATSWSTTIPAIKVGLIFILPGLLLLPVLLLLKKSIDPYIKRFNTNLLIFRRVMRD